MKIKLFLFIIIACLFWAYFVEPNRLVIKHYNLVLPTWDKALDGYKIAVVSDLHIGSRWVRLKKLEQIKKIINSLAPDLILIPGDFDAELIAASKIPESDIVSVLKQLQAPCGTVAVLGNHDYNPDNIVRPVLKNSGIKLLENECVNKYYNSRQIRVCGIKDLWHYPNTDVKEVLKGETITPTILTSHNPDIFPTIPETVSLTLSGHTHGGEVVLPFTGPLFIPSNFGKKYAKGHIIENGRHLFVSSGVASLSRFRFLNPPEVVLITISQAF